VLRQSVPGPVEPTPLPRIGLRRGCLDRVMMSLPQILSVIVAAAGVCPPSNGGPSVTGVWSDIVIVRLLARSKAIALAVLPSVWRARQCFPGARPYHLRAEQSTIAE
jgi:hypothetical protein